MLDLNAIWTASSRNSGEYLLGGATSSSFPVQDNLIGCLSGNFVAPQTYRERPSPSTDVGPTQTGTTLERSRAPRRWGQFGPEKRGQFRPLTPQTSTDDTGQAVDEALTRRRNRIRTSAENFTQAA